MAITNLILVDGTKCTSRNVDNTKAWFVNISHLSISKARRYKIRVNQDRHKPCIKVALWCCTYSAYYKKKTKNKKKIDKNNDVKMKKKVYFYKTSVIECGKKMSNIYFIGLKKDLFGCFRERRYVTKSMKQVWKREEE